MRIVGLRHGIPSREGWLAMLWLVGFALIIPQPAAPGADDPSGEALSAAIAAKVTLIREWGRAPAIVAAVKAHNAHPSEAAAGMTQERWKTLSILDPIVRAFTRNEAAEFLRAKRTEVISEAFLSGADGAKVAFLTKPSNWRHRRRPKHEVPMSGQVWQGPVETDESTGLRQVQVSVPVMEGEHPIGSLVVGLSVTRLTGPQR